jgi:hypothetical protein
MPSPTRSQGLLRTLWELMQSREARPYLRLFSEVYGLAVQQPSAFPASPSGWAAVHDWLPVLEHELRVGGATVDEASALATLALAVERGLLLDALGTHEQQRVRTAHDALLRLRDGPDGDG